MPRLSILIPDIAFDTAVEQTLVSVLQNRPEYSEVIVVTAQRYDDPYELGREVRFLSNATCTTRLDLINYGCREARGDVVHLLLPGVLALDGWTDRVLQHFADERVAAVAPVLVPDEAATRASALGVGYSTSGSRRIVGAGIHLGDRRCDQHTVLAPTLSAGFFRRDALVALQGFDPELGESLADIELGLAFRDLGLSTAVEPHARVTTNQPLQAGPRTFQEARSAELLFRRQSDTSASSLGHALLLATEMLTGFPRARMITRLAGRVVARRGADPRSVYEARLERARAELQRRVGEVSTIRAEFCCATTTADEQSGHSNRTRRSAA